MTSKFNENDENCLNCVYFEEITIWPCGICKNEKAEHYQHMIGRFHTACGLCERK